MASPLDAVEKTLETLDHVLDLFHDRVLRPLMLVGRTVAFGFVFVAFAIAVVTATLIGLVRLLDVYLFAGKEYVTYYALGGLLIVVGLLIWRRRRPVSQRKSS
jgi:hypothetical protein